MKPKKSIFLWVLLISLNLSFFFKNSYFLASIIIVLSLLYFDNNWFKYSNIGLFCLTLFNLKFNYISYYIPLYIIEIILVSYLANKYAFEIKKYVLKISKNILNINKSDILHTLYFSSFLVLLTNIIFVLFKINLVNLKLFTIIASVLFAINCFIPKLKNISKYFFLGLLVLVTISSLSFDFLINSWFGVVISYLKNIQFHLTLWSISFGVVTFYLNKEVIDEVEEEASLEEKAEVKREKEFDKKFSRFKPPKKLSIWYNLKRLFEKKGQ